MIISRPKLLIIALSAAWLSVAGCGSDSLDQPIVGQPPTQSSGPTSAADPALVEALPDKIKQSKTIIIGTDPSYAPNEFLAGDGKTIQGMDIDLFDAVAARFGVETQYEAARFDTIITGVQGRKYDIGISSLTINEERKQQAAMVSYFSAGTLWATKAGNPTSFDLENACGRTVSVQTGTVQETEDLPVRNDTCGDNPIKVLSFEGQDEATNAVVSGRAEAMLADSPVVGYAVQQADDQLAPLGEVYESAPYGYVLRSEDTAFAEALVVALEQIKESGAYDAALTKWNLTDGAIDDFAVNP